MKRLRRQALRMLRGDAAGDDDSDDDDDYTDDEEEVGTPLDNMDPFVSFADVLAGLQSTMPGRYAALVAGAEPGVIAALSAMSEHAASMRAKRAKDEADAAAEAAGKQ